MDVCKANSSEGFVLFLACSFYVFPSQLWSTVLPTATRTGCGVQRFSTRELKNSGRKCWSSRRPQTTSQHNSVWKILVTAWLMKFTWEKPLSEILHRPTLFWTLLCDRTFFFKINLHTVHHVVYYQSSLSFVKSKLCCYKRSPIFTTNSLTTTM